MSETAPSTPLPRSGSDGWRDEFRATMKLSWPLAAANLLQMLTYAIDVIFIARLGEAQLAASALAIALFGLVMWALSGLTGAVAPVASAELGERAPALRPVRRTVRMAMWLALISGIGGMGLCLLLGPLMRATGQETAIIGMALEYNTILVFSMVPMLFNNVLRSFVSTLDRPIFATAITAGGIFVNALANYAFIFGNFGAPELGLRGAAVATIITSLVTLATYVIAIRLDPRLHRYRIFGRWWSPDWGRFWHITRIGTQLPIVFRVPDMTESAPRAGIPERVVRGKRQMGVKRGPVQTLCLEMVGHRVPGTVRVFRRSDGLGDLGYIKHGVLFMP